jgi:hypothetical protein
MAVTRLALICCAGAVLFLAQTEATVAPTLPRRMRWSVEEMKPQADHTILIKKTKFNCCSEWTKENLIVIVMDKKTESFIVQIYMCKNMNCN